LDINFWGFFMSKYTEPFKLSVVQHYLSGVAGYKAVAHAHNVPYSAVRKWVNLYQAHGLGGLTKKSSSYSAEFRLSVLRRMWDEELSYGQVAAAFNIRSAGCISQWERCYHSGGLDALAPRQRGGAKLMPTLPKTEPLQSLPDPAGRTHDELVAEVNQLRMEVAYLKKLEALVQAQKTQQSTTRKKRK
jgi:transposase